VFIYGSHSPQHWIFQSSLNRRKRAITTYVWLWSITFNTYNLLKPVLFHFIYLHSSIHTGTCPLDMEFVNKLD